MSRMIRLHAIIWTEENYCWLNTYEQRSVKYDSLYNEFRLKKVRLKYRLQNIDPLILNVLI